MAEVLPQPRTAVVVGARLELGVDIGDRVRVDPGVEQYLADTALRMANDRVRRAEGLSGPGMTLSIANFPVWPLGYL